MSSGEGEIAELKFRCLFSAYGFNHYTWTTEPSVLSAARLLFIISVIKQRKALARPHSEKILGLNLIQLCSCICGVCMLCLQKLIKIFMPLCHIYIINAKKTANKLLYK